jgi:hypothetical protein
MQWIAVTRSVVAEGQGFGFYPATPHLNPGSIANYDILLRKKGSSEQPLAARSESTYW